MAGFYGAASFKTRNSISYLIKRANNQLRPRLEAAFEREELGYSQWAVLMLLRDGVAHTCAGLARELARDSGSLTRLIDQLVTRKLIRRRPSEKDRRVQELSLTPAGRAKVRALAPRAAEALNAILAEFTRSEAEQLIRLLRAFLAGVERTAGEKP
jgi:DNA-binding MarR family transcriptional regulator